MRIDRFRERSDRLRRGLPKLRRRIVGAFWKARIRLSGGHVGRRLEVDHHASLRWPPHSGIYIGDDVYLGIGAIVDVPLGASLTLGNNVKIMHYTTLAANVRIVIGALTQIAENCSIRDSDHGLSVGQSIQFQQVSTPTIIGEDVWIGRGVAILRGSHIGDGSAVGANAVVKGTLPARSIAVGVPARVIRTREAPRD